MTSTPATSKAKRASGWLSSAKQSLKSIGGASTAPSPPVLGGASPAASSNNGPQPGTARAQRDAGEATPTSLTSLPRKLSNAEANGKERVGETAAAGSHGAQSHPGRSGAVVSGYTPSIAPRKIIGAVEDEWPLYR